MKRGSAVAVQPVMSLSSASWPEPLRATIVECGSSGAWRARSRAACACPGGPPSSSAGTSGSGPVNGGRVASPASQAVVDVARAQDGLGVEGVVVGRRDRGQRLLGDGRAIGHRRRAREGQHHVGAAGRGVEADREVRLARRAALADAPQAHERAVSPGARR
jgi:hypothetical protein